jgi:hypothetical protein
MHTARHAQRPTDHEQLADQLVPLAAELVGTVRDYGPDDVAAVLARVPDGRHDALAVILAAMIDPDQTARELLAWVNGRTPRQTRYPREHGTLRGYRQHSYRDPYDPPCALCRAAHAADRADRRRDAAGARTATPRAA